MLCSHRISFFLFKTEAFRACLHASENDPMEREKLMKKWRRITVSKVPEKVRGYRVHCTSGDVGLRHSPCAVPGESTWGETAGVGYKCRVYEYKCRRVEDVAMGACGSSILIASIFSGK